MEATLRRIDLASQFSFATRTQGVMARELLIAELQAHETIEVDFGRRPISPSFADECVGVLAGLLGASIFEQRVILSGLSKSAMALLRHVIAHRTTAAA